MSFVNRRPCSVSSVTASKISSRSLMSYEVGKKALDFLIANSGTRRNLEVDFFGGEPLMNDQIIASFSVTERAHLVIYFFSSVKTDDNVVHLFVHELLNFIVQKNSVCCKCETEMLVMKFLLLSSVSRRSTTLEVHLQEITWIFPRM